MNPDNGWPMFLLYFRMVHCIQLIVAMPMLSVSLSHALRILSIDRCRLYFGIVFTVSNRIAPLGCGAKPRTAIPSRGSRPLCPVSEKYGNTSRIILPEYTRLLELQLWSLVPSIAIEQGQDRTECYEVRSTGVTDQLTTTSIIVVLTPL